jgi:hypothetical protein
MLTASLHGAHVATRLGWAILPARTPQVAAKRIEFAHTGRRIDASGTAPMAQLTGLSTIARFAGTETCTS